MTLLLTTLLTSSALILQLASSAAVASAVTNDNGIWKPSKGLSWQIELSETPTDLTYAADVFDIDLFDNTADTISKLHSNGKKVICYFSAGSYEDWRSDASNFSAADLGSPLGDWPGEWYVNISSPNVRNIMAARVQMAVTKGCDAVDPDNTDSYTNDNGLNLTQADAIDYITFLATTAHVGNLAIGLKNTLEIVSDMVDTVEFGVNESCLEYNECEKLEPFITEGKPVFHIEYPNSAPNVTAEEKTEDCAAPAGFSSILKDEDLDAWIETC